MPGLQDHEQNKHPGISLSKYGTHFDLGQDSQLV